MDKELSRGNKVRCIDGIFKDSPSNPFDITEINIPLQGKEYTVREVIRTNHGLGVLLEEIRNKGYYFDSEMGVREPLFSDDRFMLI